MLRSERQHTLGFGDCASRWVGGEVNLYEQENLPKHSESGSLGFELAVHTCRFVQTDRLIRDALDLSPRGA